MTSAELIRAIGPALFGATYQHGLAEALGVNRRTVSRWSSGEAEPRAGVWKDLLGIMWERRRQVGALIRTVEQHGYECNNGGSTAFDFVKEHITKEKQPFALGFPL